MFDARYFSDYLHRSLGRFPFTYLHNSYHIRPLSHQSNQETIDVSQILVFVNCDYLPNENN